jgi:carbamoyltransferase
VIGLIIILQSKKLSVENFYLSEDFTKMKALQLPKLSNREFVLGIGALTHDTSAAVIDFKTGQVIFAQSEERNSNLKHDSGFPIQAIKNCIEIIRKQNGTLRSVSLNFDPDLFIREGIIQNLEKVYGKQNYEKIIFQIRHSINKQIASLFDPNNNTNITYLVEFVKLNYAIDLSNDLIRVFTYYVDQFRKYTILSKIVAKLFPELEVYYFKHHKTHAASAKFNLLNNASVLVLDGHGEVSSCTLFNSDLDEVSNTFWPVSLGSFYLTSTRYLGFDYGDEYKVMGMSALGKPKFVDFLSSFINFNQETSSFEIQKNLYFEKSFINNTNQLRYEYTKAFEEMIPKRSNKSKIEQIHFDFAASVQKITEEIGLKFANSARQLINSDKLLIAGGVGLNGLMNEKIRKSGLFKEVKIYPAAGDDGTSVGAGQLLANPDKSFNIKSIFIGTGFDNRVIEPLLKGYPVDYFESTNADEYVAKLLNEKNIVARYTGRSEFGPRALGNRSILANPLDKNVKDTLNLRIKHREEFRPFAPAVLADKVNEFFHFDEESPFMLFITKARSELGSICPGIVHKDSTARIQTVDKVENRNFYNLIFEFYKISGVPILVNTSFNLNGEAIVDTPQDAIESFLFMDIDYLVIDNFIVKKSQLAPRFNLQFKTHNEFLAQRKERYTRMDPHSLKMVDCRIRI